MSLSPINGYAPSPEKLHHTVDLVAVLAIGKADDFVPEFRKPKSCMRDKNAACFNHRGDFLRVDFLPLSFSTNDMFPSLINKFLL